MSHCLLFIFHVRGALPWGYCWRIAQIVYGKFFRTSGDWAIAFKEERLRHPSPCSHSWFMLRGTAGPVSCPISLGARNGLALLGSQDKPRNLASVAPPSSRIAITWWNALRYLLLRRFRRSRRRSKGLPENTQQKRIRLAWRQGTEGLSKAKLQTSATITKEEIRDVDPLQKKVPKQKLSFLRKPRCSQQYQRHAVRTKRRQSCRGGVELRPDQPSLLCKVWFLTFNILQDQQAPPKRIRPYQPADRSCSAASAMQLRDRGLWDTNQSSGRKEQCQRRRPSGGQSGEKEWASKCSKGGLERNTGLVNVIQHDIPKSSQRQDCRSSGWCWTLQLLPSGTRLTIITSIFCLAALVFWLRGYLGVFFTDPAGGCAPV